jgi:predicted ester cyclase
MNGGRVDVVEEVYSARLAPAAKRWIVPFLASYPDTRMEVVDLIAEDDKIVGRFVCSETHLGDWLGHAPTGRRFEIVGEVCVLCLRGGRIVSAQGIEDTVKPLEHLRLR